MTQPYIPLQIDVSCSAGRGADRAVRVTWQTQNRRIAPGELAEPLLGRMGIDELGPADRVLAGGRAPLWLYAALTLEMLPSGAVMGVLDPKLDGFVVVAPNAQGFMPGSLMSRSTPLEPATVAAAVEPPAWVVAHEAEGASAVFRFARPPEQLAPSVLARLPQALECLAAAVGEVRRIVWDGPAPTWLAAAWAAAVDQRWPRHAIGIHAPPEGGVVIVKTGSDAPEPRGLVVGDQPGHPRLIGVVGDPNSGKSVFTLKLYRELLALGCSAYRFDADVRAPTAPWGILTEGGRQLRTSQKVEWNDAADVPMLLQALRNLAASSLAVILIDLPGGIHQETVERIPPGRRELFRAIPEYFVVQRDEAAAAAWRQALRSASPAARVVGEILSRRSPPVEAVGAEADGRWPVQPLDRAAVHEPDPCIQALARMLVRKPPSSQETS